MCSHLHYTTFQCPPIVYSSIELNLFPKLRSTVLACEITNVYASVTPVSFVLQYGIIQVSTAYSYITKTRLYNFDPLKPHFYIVKLGFTGVYIIFLILLKKHRLWVLVRTASGRRF